MRLIVHPLIRRDLRSALEFYDLRSDRAGDVFFAEFEDALERIEIEPTRFHRLDERRRRCNFQRFPYHLVFEIRGKSIGVMVLRHHQRKPSYGLTRKW